MYVEMDLGSFIFGMAVGVVLAVFIAVFFDVFGVLVHKISGWRGREDE